MRKFTPVEDFHDWSKVNIVKYKVIRSKPSAKMASNSTMGSMEDMGRYSLELRDRYELQFQELWQKM